MTSKDPVKTAARTLDLFEAFARARAPLSLTELAQRIDSPISSCHALVRTLQARGYVYMLDQRKRVYPTKRLYAIADIIARHDPLLDKLLPLLEALMRKTGETVLLGKRQGDGIRYLEVVEGQHTVRYAARPGDAKPLYSSAVGKAMLGQLEDGELHQLVENLAMPQVTEHTITEAEALCADIAAGRERGYFQTRGENVADVMALSIARSVLNETLGIALAGPTSRMDANKQAYLKALWETGQAFEALDAELSGRTAELTSLDVMPAP